MATFDRAIIAALCFAVTAAFVAALPSSVLAQGNPTGTIRGRVVDASSLPLSDVAVTAASPALQGQRRVTTSANGDFIIPFLPPGDYVVRFDLAGFKTHTHRVGVTMAETLPMQVTLAVANIAESVTVNPSSTPEQPRALTVAETIAAKEIEWLPVGRTLIDAVLLAPGVANTGPTQSDGSRTIVIAGALSYQNLFLIDGVDVNENLRGQPLPVYIEDAIQETKVSIGNISAEYGRFQGGVVNMITKDGGNRFSGSFRTSFTDDRWQARTPYAGDQKIASLTPTYEATAGGPIRSDRLWFFGSGQSMARRRNATLDFTGTSYTVGTDDTRGEGKVTYAITPRHSLKASYVKRTLATTNDHFDTVMDRDSLYDDSTSYTRSAVNETSILTSHLFLEGQLSRKTMTTTDVGSRFTDLAHGTPIWDRSRGQARFNAPTFCAVCGDGWLEARNNWDWFAKLTYFLSTAGTGSHSLVFGVDNFKETRQNDNWLSGSTYRIQSTSAIIDGTTIFPVFDTNSTYIEYVPLVAESVGNDLRTYSAFVNDAWQLSTRLSFNVGLRYDLNQSKDQTGVPVVRDSAFSPRLSVTWDPDGSGRWAVRGGFARYVAGISTALVDQGSAGGRTATYSYFYQGPPINTGSGPYLTAPEALPRLFDWFFANGGLNRSTRNAPSIPGVTTRVDRGTTAPHANELSAGVSRDYAGRGSVRVDYLYRRYRDFYANYVTPSTGQVVDPTGRAYDLTIVRNTPDATRTYQGVLATATYRGRHVQISGDYTLSWSRGNVDAENSSSGPLPATINAYPEYKSSWFHPVGYNSSNQRHKLRAWLIAPIPVPNRLGTLQASLLQRFDSALPYDAVGGVDSRPYVINPGYLTPPSTVSYYFSGRNAFRFDPAWSTDISLEWSRHLGSRASTFFRVVTTNLFNRSAVVSGDSTILTAALPGSVPALQPFNPFTTAPIEGVNWARSPTFGQPTGPDSYQVPRTFSCSLGFRF